MTDLQPPESTAPFAEHLGYLVTLLRQAPERETEIARGADALALRVSRQPGTMEAGIENSWALDGDPLKQRLSERGVDSIWVAPGAPREELLALAKALSEDGSPIPSTDLVQVALVAAPLSGPSQPPARPAYQAGDPRQMTGGLDVPRPRKDEQLTGLVETLIRELAPKLEGAQWHLALHEVQAAIRLLPGLSDDFRPTYTISLRRMLTREVMEAFIEQAYRIPEEQTRTIEVIRFAGPRAAERILEILRATETLGPRAFLLEAVGGMPDALPVVMPLLKSERPWEAWLAAELCGRIGGEDAVPGLLPLVSHPDERVRLTAIDALAQFRDRNVVETLRLALAHPSAATRARAARALASRRSAALAMPILAALEGEREPGAWRELLGALASIDAPEAGTALTRMALTRKGIFSRHGHTTRERLEVVRTLAEAGTQAARQALQRIAQEADEEVAAEARRLQAAPAGDQAKE